MKPIRLEIEGINSFSDRQVIDFRPLIKAGLFGIFGNTGSGKSTILDCIMLALYGRSEKGQKGDFVNVKKWKGRVVFQFETREEGKNVLYEVVREFPLKENREAKVASAVLYREENGAKCAVEEGMNRVSERLNAIIGLSYEDFKKCIVLPQGEFDRFVKSPRRDRLDIVGRLFSLDRYGFQLQDKVQQRWGKLKGEIDQIDAEYRFYEDYRREDYRRMEAELMRREEERAKREEEYVSLKRDIDREERTERILAELAEAKAKLIEFENALPKVEARREKIARAEGAGQVIAYLNAAEEAKEELSAVLINLEKNEKLKEKSNKILSDIMNDEAYIRYQETTDALTEKLALAGAYFAKESDLKEREKKIEALQKKAADAEREISSLNADVGRLEVLLADLEEKIAGLAQGDVFSMFERSVEKIILSRELADWKNYFSDWLKALPAYGTSPLQTAVSLDFKKELALIEERLNELNLAKEDADELKRALYEALETHKKRESERSAAEKERSALESARAVKRKEAENRAERLSDWRDELERTAEETREERGKINAFTGGKGVKEIFDALSLEKNRLAEKKERWDKILDETRGVLTTAAAERAALEEKIAYLKKIIQENQKIMKQNMEKCGIISITQAREAFLSEEQVAVYQRENDQFQQRLLYWQETRAHAEEQLGGASVDVAALNARRARLAELDGMLRSDDGTIAAQRVKLEDYLKMLEKKREIEKRKAEKQRRFALVDQLSSLVKKQSLMEFVADEYLSEIAHSASFTLSELTLGRYSLDYEREFFISDNLNGGMKRSVNTLSGGEVFLVSLSLAVALSGAICEKSNTPIEFFFLDEGFGALDETLVDTVMDSLEKLKNTHFSIGLISHVAELKHRINAKILVRGATEERGSVVSLSI